MSGESRAAFHAVPRIIKVDGPDGLPDCLRWKPELFSQRGEVSQTSKEESLRGEISRAREEFQIAEISCCCKESSRLESREKTKMILSAEEWKPFSIYLSKTRININVRQVHERGRTVQTLN